MRAGARLTVTERGKPIATLAPIEPKNDHAWIWKMVAEGRAHWSGGKPTGSKNPVKVKADPATFLQIAGDRALTDVRFSSFDRRLNRAALAPLRRQRRSRV